MRVAYQGEAGAFSENAAKRLLGAEIVGVPCHSFEDMFASVGLGNADFIGQEAATDLGHQFLEGVSCIAEPGVLAESGKAAFMAGVVHEFMECGAVKLPKAEEAQGQLPLTRCSGKDFQQERFAPAAAAPFHGDTVLAGMLF